MPPKEFRRARLRARLATLLVATLAIFGLSVVSGVSTPAQAASTGSITNTPQWSLGGGGTQDINCSAGSVLRGIYSGYSSANTALTAVKSYCDPLNANGNGTTNSPTKSSTYGGSDTTSQDGFLIDCGANFVLVGVNAASPGVFTSYATPICASLPLGNNSFLPPSKSTTKADQYLGAWSSSFSNRQTLQCSAGTVAVGLHMRTGGIEDAIGLNCAPITGSTISSSATATGTNAAQCSQAGTNLGYGSSDVTVVADSRGYCVIQFINPAVSYSWTVPAGVTSVDLFALGGGGGGGPDGGGGGGGGELRIRKSLPVSSGNAVTVAVGAGGTGGCWTGVGCTYNGGTGSSSTITYSGSTAVSATGGGGSGGWSGSQVQGSGGTNGSGGTGYAGGGGGTNDTAQTSVTQGTEGNTGPNATFISSTPTYYGGGGGGGGCYATSSSAVSGKAGGAGGGGIGASYNSSTGSPAGGYGTENLGGGGGGGSACDGGNTSVSGGVANGVNQRTAGGKGGAGLVAIRYQYSIETTVTATGTNAALCNQTGTNLGTGSSSQITAVGLSNGYCVVTFLDPSIAYSWTVPTGVSRVNVLVVGGGGGGAGNYTGDYAAGGGGGGGGVYSATNVPVSGNIPISVGGGGAGGPSNSARSNPAGSQGGLSAFTTLTAGGGGGGNCGGTTCPSTIQNGGSGTAGGSGGGATLYWGANNAGSGATGSSVTIGGVTFSGINGYNGSVYNSSIGGASGGGGGAGGNATTTTVGPGVSSSITGSAATYGAGGGTYGVTGWSYGAATGYGTGGSGAYLSNSAQNGANGANGIVVLSYQPLPTLTSITPIYGPLGGSTTVTATGTNFFGSPTVTVGGTAATSVVVNSTTSLTFNTPSGTTGMKDVVVTTLGGSATLSASFTYGANSVTATGTNASACAQTGTNLGNGTTDVTAVGLSTGYCVVTFKTTGISYSWTVPTGVTTADILLVGGGGAGGMRGGAGGGAGGYLYRTSVTLTPAAPVTVGVGSGGLGTSVTNTPGGNGGNSTVTISGITTTVIGGGGGGTASASSNTARTGSVGGSGGGSTGAQTSGTQLAGGGVSVAGQGNSGGAGPADTNSAYSNWPAGGGGGAGSAGSTPSNNSNGGAGGSGIASAITGTNTCYATGGGGGIGANLTGGAAGSCTSFAAAINGGSGTSGVSTPATPTANTGAGGGGSGFGSITDVAGGNGATGVVIVSYPMPPSAGTATISGTTQVGSVLTASTNTAAATSTTYQWQSATTSTGTYSNISGATSSTYTLTTSDFNTYLKVLITLTNSSGTATQTSVATAVVTVASPTVTAVSPSYGVPGGATSVSITGTNFQGVTSVKFGATNAASYTVVSPTSITATSPAGSVATVDITVTNGTGTSATSASDKFTFGANSVSATGTNASYCAQTGNNLGNGTTDVTAVATSNGYCVVTFTNPTVTYQWNVPTGVTSVRTVVVGGGAGGDRGVGAYFWGHGGGGGQVVDTTATVSGGTAVSIAVGAAGTAGIGTATWASTTTVTPTTTGAGNGGSSSFGSTTAAGGQAASLISPSGGTSGSGKVGGVGSGSMSAGGCGNLCGAGGGGGAGAAGSGLNGGAGVFSDITGTSTEYGAGGAGRNNNGFGTAGGGASVGADALANRGGGGSDSGGANGTNGGSGVVIVSYGMFVSYTYNANNGTGSSPAGGSVQGGTSFTTAANPYTRNGYTFTGWNTAANGSGTALTANASNTMPASATALVFYAQWTANSNTVTFNSQGGSAVASSSWSTGTALTLPAAPTRAGYTFDGWYDSASGGSRVIKNALSFDGVNDRITIPHSTAFNFTNAMTIEAWINTTSTSAQYIATKGDDSFYIQLTAAGAVGVYLNGSPATGWIYSSTTVNDGNWHHVAVTYNGSLVKIIIDGVERASTGWTGTILTGTSSVEVGSRTNNVGASYGSLFAGKMYDLRYWNIARSASDIASTMNTELTGTETGLVAAYLLNQGSPGATNTGVSTATSSKSGSSSGTLLNFALTGTSSNWVSRSASYTPTNTSAFTLYAQWVAQSNDATLSGLALSVGTLSPTFASTTTSYTASVSNATTSLTVTPTVNQANATVQVKIGAGSYASVTSGSASSALTLAVGLNTITVLVTAQDGSTTQIDTITVTRVSNDASISGLTISAGTLSPSFVSGTITYTASVSNATTSITLTPTATQANATLTVNGATVTSGNASGAISLSVGSNTITVVGTAQDGTTTKTYTLTVTRNSNDATLSSLTVLNGTFSPSFVSSTTSYNVYVASNVTSVQVTPTVNQSNAAVKVNGTTVTSGQASASISANSGNATITVIATAQDGTTTQTYTLTVIHLSADATLSALTLSTGTLSPTFVGTTTSYSASVSNATSSIMVTPTVNQANATAVIYSGSTGTTAFNGNLSVGVNVVRVFVTSQDGLGTKTYTLTITRLSNDATLSGLTIPVGTLSPTFSSATTTYSSYATTSTSAMAITATANQSNATIKVNGSTVTSGSQSQFITLNLGVNTISIVVTAQDGVATQTYTLTVTQLGVPTVSVISPSSGTTTGGTSVTLTGTNFTGTSSITVGGAAATNISVASDTSVTFTTPSGTAGAANIVLTSPGGTVTKTGAFTYLAAPTIGSASISGTAQVGSTLTAAAGSVTGSSITMTYQWQSSPTSGGTYTNISLATGSTYTAVSADAAKFIKVVITVTNTGGSASQTSSATTAVLLTAPTLSSATISGTAQVGSTLTATPGTITGTSTTTTYQWQSASTSGGTYSNIASATSSTYTAVAADAGNFIKVVITVTNNGGTASQTSSATTVVLNGAPTLASASITGTAQVGATLTAVSGVATGSATTTTYQWQIATTVGGAYSNISSATSSTYIPVTADASKFIKVVITVTNNGGSASQTSAATSAVLIAGPTLASASITGTPQVLSTLTAVSGAVTGTSTTTTYQWQSASTANGTYSNISGATASTYTLAAADAGQFLEVVITVTNSGGTTSQTSAATSAVALAAALTPTFGSVTQTADGFTVAITNYNALYTWPTPTTTAGSISVGTPSGTSVTLTVTGLNPGASATITQTTTRTGYTSGTANTTGSALNGAALTPAFGPVTSTADGFTVQITNYNSSYTWATPIVSAGSISVGTPVGGIETLTVTGLTPTSSAMITQTVTRTGYNSGSGTVTGSALIGAALVPTFSSVTQTSTGFTVSVTNYNAIFTWATPTTTAGTVTVGTPSGSTRLITVSGLNPGSSATLTVTTSRTSYTGGSASINGSSNLSSDKTLSSLVISSGTLSPVFSSSTSNYNVTVANSVSSITITPTVNQINASVEAKIGSGTNSLLTSGAASGALSLAIGSNTLTITVTAQDLTTGTYVLTVTRSASADATLATLTISSGTLSPIFSSLTTAYAVSLANSVSTLTVTPTANQAYATIQAKVGSGSYSTVYSGTATSSLNLAVGANTITILVTAQDGSTTNTYSVIATRAPPSHGVTYNLGNGSGTLPTQAAIAEGSTFTLAASTGLTYAGYTFNKWNDGTANYSAGATYTMSTSNVVLTATWTPTSQTVTYLAGTGGSGTAPIQAAVATAATFTTASNTFTRTGYNFAGWYDGTNTYLASATYTMGINNVTLTATWTPQVYTVTYDANGASGSASRTTDSYTYGTSAINLPTVGTMALTGYTFGGWSTSGNTPAISGAYTPAASVTLKAIWTPNVYTVSFSINGATGTTPTSINYTVGTTAIALSNGSGLSYPGYRFDGWATTTGGSSVGTTYIPTASITLQAIWTAIDYTISYSLNGGTSAQPSSFTKTVGTTFTVEAAPTQSGYVFAGWSYNSNTYSAGSTFTVGTSNVAFTAVWIPLYTVHYVMNGSLTSAPVDQLQPSGTSITLEAAPTRVGYTFGGWRDQAGTTRSALASFTVAADSTLTAVWSAIPYTVTYTLTPAPGTAPSQFTVTIGSVFTLASTPVWAGYSFLGWNDGTTNYGGGSSYLVGTQNIAFVAQWSANDFTVDYEVNGASSSVPVSLVKNVSQTFQLPAAPSKAGWIFDNWSDGTATYSAGATYTMPASNVILTANYHAPAPTITSLSATSGSVLGGTAITLTGTNFTLATAVTVGGAAAVFVINSDTSISIITPAGSNGSANIVLTATGGSAMKSGFSYSLLSQSPVALTTTSGTAGTAISLVATGGSGTGSVSFMTITSGCSTVDISGTTYLNAAHPVTCVVAATKAADSTYASSTTVFNVPFVKIASTVALALPSNAIFASYNFTISLSAATNTPGSVTFSDDGTRIGSCNNVATSSNVASCLWTPTDIKTGKVLTALFTPTNTTDYETSTATVLVNVVASSLSGLNPADLYQLGSLSALSNGANSQTFTTTDTTLVLTVPANALPSGSTVHLLIDTNGSSLQTIIGTGGYLLNSIVAWNAPDGSVPAASVPISLAITNSSIRKGMVIYGILNGVTTPLGKASTNGSVTVYLSQDPVIVIAPTKPDAPTSVLASNGQNQSSVVSWLAPSNDGGQTITQYTVTASGAGGQTCTTTNSLSCTVNGLLNGTSYTFTVTATNAVGTSDPSSQSPSVTPVGPPTIITPTTGLTATYGSSYTLQIVASGSAQIQSYAVHSGSLPSGLSLNSVSGLITGTPSAAGTYSGISISVTDANLQSSNTSLFAIVVNPESVTATLSISPTTVASNGTSYTATITPSLTLSGSSSGAITYAISGGTATNCVITGTTTLTLTANTSGTCSFTATQAADSNYAAVTTAPVTFTFTKAIPAPIVITTTSGQVNTPLTIVTSGGSGTGTDNFTTSGTGCSISGSTLTATQLGTCAVTVSNPGDVYYSSESTTATISIGQITLNVPTSISTSSSAGTTVSVTFTGDSNGTTNLIIYTDGTTTTALRTITGYTSGTPVTGLTPGTTYYVSLISIGTGNYANSAATSRQTVTTLAQAATPSVSIAPSSSSLTLGQSISFVATANVSDGGTLTYRWSFGGVTIDSATASTYTFTPSQTSQAGVYTVTVSNSKNGTQTTANATASLSISGALSISTPSTGLNGTVGTALTPISAPAGGGAGTLSYAVTTGLTQLTALGLGLDSSTATAQIIGTPVAAGTATIVITVTDANSQSVSTSAFTITIGAAAQNLAFTLSASTAASTGTSFEARLTPTLTLAGAGTGAVTYSLIGGTATGCQILNSSTIETITATTAGTCQIVATKAADANYLSATSSTLTFTFTRAAQTPLVITSSRTGTLAAPLTLTTSGGSGSGAVTFAVTGTNCVLSGSSLSATAATACDVMATKQADTYYETATSTTVNVNFGLASLNAPVITTVNPNGSTTSLTVAYTADSHGTSVTLNVYAASTDTSPAKSVTNFVSGNAVSGLTAGTTYYIGLSSVGNATYANSAESTRAPGATLVGAIAPVIDTQTVASSLNLTVGQIETLTVTAHSTDGGTLSYQWNFGGNAIPGATSNTYVFTVTSILQSGNYSVTVTEALNGTLASTASNNVAIAVAGPIAVATPSAGLSATNGFAYSLQIVAAGGTSPLTYSVATGAADLAAAGFSLNAQTGLISGLTAETGTVTVSITVTDAVNSSATTSLFTITLLDDPDAPIPTFSAPVSTNGGFTVIVTNYDATFTESAMVSAGTITNSIPNGSNWLLTVNGLTPGQSATITVTTTRVGYVSGTATVTGTASNSLPPITYTPYLGQGVAASAPVGYTVIPSNLAQVLHATLTVNLTTVRSLVTFAPMSSPVPSWQTPFVITGAIQVVDIYPTGLTGKIQVCLDGTSSDRLWHFINGSWVDITDSHTDTQVCGFTTTFSPFGVGVPVPVVPLPSIFVVKSPVKISLSGNTFTFTAATLEFSYHGAQLQPAVLVDQEINLMADGKVIRNLRLIAPTATITLDKVERGVVYTFQEIVSQADATDAFTSHNTTIEYGISLHDRIVRQNLEKQYFVALNKALQVYIKATNALSAERLIRPKKPLSYFAAMTLKIHAQRRASQAEAAAARQQGLRDLQLRDYAELRAAGVSIFLP